MRRLIHGNAAEYELENHARRHAASIRDDGLLKVLAGKTTLEEVLRVTNEAAEE
jgi:general secretion pathway protein E